MSSQHFILAFRCHWKTRPFNNWMTLHYSNTRIVLYSDPCSMKKLTFKRSLSFIKCFPRQKLVRVTFLDLRLRTMLPSFRSRWTTFRLCRSSTILEQFKLKAFKSTIEVYTTVTLGDYIGPKKTSKNHRYRTNNRLRKN